MLELILRLCAQRVDSGGNFSIEVIRKALVQLVMHQLDKRGFNDVC